MVISGGKIKMHVEDRNKFFSTRIYSTLISTRQGGSIQIQVPMCDTNFDPSFSWFKTSPDPFLGVTIQHVSNSYCQNLRDFLVLDASPSPFFFFFFFFPGKDTAVVYYQPWFPTQKVMAQKTFDTQYDHFFPRDPEERHNQLPLHFYFSDSDYHFMKFKWIGRLLKIYGLRKRIVGDDEHFRTPFNHYFLQQLLKSNYQIQTLTKILIIFTQPLSWTTFQIQKRLFLLLVFNRKS